MKNLLSFLLLSLITVLHAQDLPDINSFDPDEILIGDDELPQVLLVGTFHFNYPNLDAHVTAEEDQVDVEQGARRAELQELLDYLARFRPTKIVVERWPESNINQQYEKYLTGMVELPKSEVYQLGFRLAEQFEHEQLYPCDAGTLVNSLYNHRDSTVLRPLLDSIYSEWGFESTVEMDFRYDSLYDLEDEILAETSLLDYFKYENSHHRILRGHGAYLTGAFGSNGTNGQDALAMHWYARNLRIFRNIQSVATEPDDRVMVIFGAGHLGILRQQLESYPGMELVEFGDL
ncbi:MAG: DUF5694 domain-containing protein [Bacteroidota bacterium]